MKVEIFSCIGIFSYICSFRMSTCWTITNGTAGTTSQALGLAQSVGFKKIEQKVFKAKFTLSLIPSLAHVFLKKFLANDSGTLEGPWPDVIIGCGRRTIPFLLYIKRASSGRTYCIYIQDPKISPKYFDLVIKMDHDSIEGENVLSTAFSLNLINRTKLLEETKKFRGAFAKLPKPYYTILIGGDTKRYKMNDKAINDLLDKVGAIVEFCPGSVLVTTSRRTPDSLREGLASKFKENTKFYMANSDCTEKNPYFAILELAEKIFVTNDSVNMISEACACRKLVCIIPLLNISLGRSKKFLEGIIAKGWAFPFNCKNLKKQKKIALSNNEMIAAKVREKLLEHKK